MYTDGRQPNNKLTIMSFISTAVTHTDFSFTMTWRGNAPLNCLLRSMLAGAQVRAKSLAFIALKTERPSRLNLRLIIWEAQTWKTEGKNAWRQRGRLNKTWGWKLSWFWQKYKNNVRGERIKRPCEEDGFLTCRASGLWWLSGSQRCSGCSIPLARPQCTDSLRRKFTHMQWNTREPMCSCATFYPMKPFVPYLPCEFLMPTTIETHTGTQVLCLKLKLLWASKK